MACIQITAQGRQRQGACKFQTMLGYKPRPYLRRRKRCYMETEFEDRETNQSVLRVYRWSHGREMIKLVTKSHFPMWKRQVFL